MAKRSNSNRGGHSARLQQTSVVADPNGNREQRRAAAKVARMNPEAADKLPQRSEDDRSRRWTPGGGE